MSNTAIILSAGRGNRMESDLPKQYMPLGGYPVIYHSIKAFEDCDEVDDIILVVGSEEDAERCRTDIIEKNGFKKVSGITLGGTERYLSVYEGIRYIEERAAGDISEENVGGGDGDDSGFFSRPDILLIHDGARCLVTPDIISRTIADAREYGDSVAAMPVKDTIKRAPAGGFSVETLPREELWQIQTPQTFSYILVRDAYMKLLSQTPVPAVTDDAMVVELMTDTRVRLTRGSYNNIKLTTPEDMVVAEALLHCADEL